MRSPKNWNPAEVIAEAVKPEMAWTVSAWADKYRILPRVSAGEPGPWKTARTPYLRQIMDSMSPIGGAERVVFIKPAQIGGTESLLNMVGYIIHMSPGPTLLVQPTVELAERFSKQRLASLIDSTPELRSRITPADERNPGNTISVKQFPGGCLILAGSNSAAGLKSMPAKFILLDETDSYPSSASGSAGSEGGSVSEGDPIDLAIARSETFPNRRIIMVSTPTIRGLSRIEQAYSESDQRKYWVPCPHCRSYQILRWAQMKWPEGEPDRAVYECVACNAPIGDQHKPAMLAAGEWRTEAAGDGRTVGFWLSALYSPWVTWSRLAYAFLRASKSPERLKVFVNTRLAETWEEAGAEKLDIDVLMTRREPIGDTVPAGAAILTLGCDVQQDRLEAVLYGWGIDEETWLLGHYVLRGDTTRPDVWRELDAILKREYRHEYGFSLRVSAACIDSGFASGTVYAFCRDRYNRKIFAVKGRSGRHPVWPRQASRGRDRTILFLVGVDGAKDWLASHLRIPEPGPGFIHFPLTIDQTFFEQLASETVRIRYTHGFAVREWFKAPGSRNETLDATVYAYAALQSLIVGGVKLNAYAEKIAAMRKDTPATQAKPPEPQKPRSKDPWYRDDRRDTRRNSWLGDRTGWLDRVRR